MVLFFILLVYMREPPHSSSAVAPLTDPAHQPPDLSLRTIFSEILVDPLVLRLIVTFIGANFVAMAFMVWLPTFLLGKFHMSLVSAGANATIYLQAASVAGVLCGGVLADLLVRRKRSGRVLTQALGLLDGPPRFSSSSSE